MNDHDACIILNMLNGTGEKTAWKPNRGPDVNAMIETCGSVSAVLQADSTTLSRIGGIDAGLAERMIRRHEFTDLGRELDDAKNAGATILCYTDDEYPDSLRGLPNPPLCLYVLGALPADLAARSLAIVGTRTPTDSGVRMARGFAESAVRHGWSTVSGLAPGIDSAAHLATIEAGGRTVAVPGSGLSDIFPPENLELARAIVRAGGALVSEYPMDTEATSNTLLRRNRIIAALSCRTLVVEAAKRSGALKTARTARELGRPVFAVPGADGNPVAEGANNLIREGAIPVTDFSGLLDKL